MAVILSITAVMVGTIARLDVTTDTVAAADVAFILDYYQAAIEQTLDPAAFTAGVTDLLTINVARLLAADVLEMRHTADGASGDLQIGTGSSEIKLTKVPNFPEILRATAYAVLSPYMRKQSLLVHKGPTPAATPSAPQQVDSANQDLLYDPSEVDRMTSSRSDNGRW